MNCMISSEQYSFMIRCYDFSCDENGFHEIIGQLKKCGFFNWHLTCSWRSLVLSFSSSTCLSHSRQKSSSNWVTSEALVSLKNCLARSWSAVNEVSALFAGCRCGDRNWLMPYLEWKADVWVELTFIEWIFGIISNKTHPSLSSSLWLSK